MNFDFNEEQYLFQESFKSFLDNQYPLSVFIKSMEGEEAFGKSRLWNSLSELGLFSILVPEEYGGLDLSFVDLALILEELGAALVPAPVSEMLAVQDLLVRFGSLTQKSKLLPGLSSGETVITLAAQEHAIEYGTSTQTTLSPHGEGWLLDGQKIMVPGVQNSDYIVVLATVLTTGCVVPVLVSPEAVGVSTRLHESLDGSAQASELNLDKVLVQDGDIVGVITESAASNRLYDSCAYISAACATGVARKALDIAVGYASQRVQFDKPIGSFQAIKHRCADMAVALDAAQSASYYASWAMSENSTDRARAVSIAKTFCGETAQDLCQKCIQIHGGMGFTWELGIHYYLRRACVLNAGYGNSTFHRERVVAETISQLEQSV